MIKLKDEQARARKDGLNPIEFPLLWLVNKHEGGKKFDAAKYANIMANMGSNLTLFISDPEIVQDMISTKNASIDKTGEFEGIFKNFFGNSFLFAKSDELWKAKRKSVAHAFYKDRLV